MHSLDIQSLAVWLSDNTLVSINTVALRWARLGLGLVTVTILVFNQATQTYAALAIPPWVGTMSTGDSLSHH